MDTAFKVLQQKEIYEFLEGSGDQELVIHKGQSYGLPYLSGTDLDNICRAFGVTEPLGGSRWTYVEALVQYAIDNDRCDEMLTYLFSLDKFKNLKEMPHNTQVQDSEFKSVKGRLTLPPQKGSEGKLTQA